MKLLLLMSLFVFVVQSDTVKTDSVVNPIQEQRIVKEVNQMDSKLDSIIAILKNDTIKKK